MLMQERKGTVPSFETAMLARASRHINATRTYEPQHTATEYVAFLERQGGSLRRIHPQDTAHYEYWAFYSDMTGLLYGDCVAECLDQAIAIEGEHEAAQTAG